MPGYNHMARFRVAKPIADAAIANNTRSDACTHRYVNDGALASACTVGCLCQRRTVDVAVHRDGDIKGFSEDLRLN